MDNVNVAPAGSDSTSSPTDAFTISLESAAIEWAAVAGRGR